MGVNGLTIVPKRRRRKRRAIDNIKRGVALFIIFLGLSLVVHETFHLVVARALGYEPDIFYGVEFPNIYGAVQLDRPCDSSIHTLLIFAAGGIGTGLVFYILWSTIDDIVAKLLLSFFTSTHVVYGIIEPLYGFGLLGRGALGIVPMVAGIITMIIFRIIYWRLGWW